MWKKGFKVDDLTFSVDMPMPDPYENVYNQVLLKFHKNIQAKENEGALAALKELGFEQVVHCYECSMCGGPTEDGLYECMEHELYMENDLGYCSWGGKEAWNS